jgi:ribose transport system substrate-binding protein
VHFIPRSEAPPDQITLIDEVIRNKPDASVVAPFDAKAMVPLVERISAAGIPVIDVTERLANGTAVSYVGTDDYELALATARYLIKAMGGKGSVVILEGPENRPAGAVRVKGFKDALKELPDAKLLASKSGNYARTSAADVMKGFLRSYPQIDGVLAANDPMAIGAVDALKAANKKALVVGINGNMEVLDLIKSGDILASGDYNGFLQGCLGVEVAVRHLRKQPVPKELVLTPVVVDKSNYRPYETPMEQRTCPTLESVAGK